MSRRPSLMPRSGGLVAGRLFGIEIRLDPTWFIWIVLLPIVWVDTRASESVAAQWLVGLAIALLLAVCIVLHELAHSLTARAYGLPVRRITLFMLGGVSQMEREAPTAESEFHIALAGPLASLVLATILGGVAQHLYPHQPLRTSMVGVLAYINLVLALFNLVPAFPMDGGRILRSALWTRIRSRARATKLAAGAGRGFGALMMAVGIGSTGASLFVSGVEAYPFFALVGVFVYNAASAAAITEGGEQPNAPQPLP